MAALLYAKEALRSLVPLRSGHETRRLEAEERGHVLSAHVRGSDGDCERYAVWWAG